MVAAISAKKVESQRNGWPSTKSKRRRRRLRGTQLVIGASMRFALRVGACAWESLATAATIGHWKPARLMPIRDCGRDGVVVATDLRGNFLHLVSRIPQLLRTVCNLLIIRRR